MQTDWLQRWWCKKFNLPRKDPRLLSYTLEELMVEYLEDMIEHDPMEAWSSADIGFKRTGDKAIDKWEQEIADGKTPDLGETIDPKVLERWLNSSRRASTLPAPTPEPSKSPASAEEVAEEFSDRYDEDEVP